MGRRDEFQGSANRQRIHPVELISAAVTKLDQQTPAGLPEFYVEDASDAGRYCGPGCAERTISQPDFMSSGARLREMGTHERILPEQFSDPADRRLLSGRQFQTESLDDDDFFWESGGATKHVVSITPIDVEREGLAELAQGECDGPGCGKSLVPGGAPRYGRMRSAYN